LPIYKVANATKNTTLGAEITLADSSEGRRKGLLKQDGLAEGAGLWIYPSEAVHTLFMRFAIDVIFLDGAKRVRKISANLRPWRMSGCLTAKSVLELPAGAAERTQTTVGDQLVFERLEA